MKKLFLSALCIGMFLTGFSQEYRIVTSVESIIPGGLGRSRVLVPTQQQDSDEFTTERTNGKKGNAQNQVKRRELRINNFEETKLLNFYSLTGINFQNVATNDALVSDLLSDMAREGWQLQHVTSGVESDAGKPDGDGIYITRYIFYRE